MIEIMFMMTILGIGVFIVLALWMAFARAKFKSAVLLEASKKKLTEDLSNRPKTLKEYCYSPDSETYFQYLRLLDEFERLALLGTIDVTSLELEKIKYSVSNLWYNLWVKHRGKHKIVIYVAVVLSILLVLPGCLYMLQMSDGSFIDIVYFIPVVLGVSWIFGYFAESQNLKNLTRFESLINKYYSFHPDTANEVVKSSDVSRLFELNRLRELGVITNEEFTKFKARVLNPS